MSNPRRQLAIRGLIFVLLIVLLFFFSRYIPRPFSAFAPPGEDFDDFEGIYSSSDKLSKFLQNLGPYSPAVFVLFQVLQVIAAPFPGELTGVAGGYVYGETFGFLLSTIGLSLGSWVAFELATILGRPFVERFVKREVLEKFNFLTTKTGTLICFVLFLFPGFPKDYLCYVLGLSRMKLEHIFDRLNHWAIAGHLPSDDAGGDDSKRGVPRLLYYHGDFSRDPDCRLFLSQPTL